MIHLTVTLKTLLFGTGLFAGTVDAIAGGGGLITLPLLVAIGLPAPIALGTNKLQSSIGTSVATFNYFKNKLISLHVIMKGLLFGFVGASLGSLSAQYVDSSFLEKFLPFLMLTIFIYTIYSPKLGLSDSHQRMREPLFYMLFGFVLGFYDGFLGPGTGSFWVASLVYFLGYNLAKATAYTKVFNLKSNLIALSWFTLGGCIDYQVGLIMACGQLIGGKLGSQLVIKKGAGLVRPIFLSIVFVTILTMFYRGYFANAANHQLTLLVTALGIVLAYFVIRGRTLSSKTS